LSASLASSSSSSAAAAIDGSTTKKKNGNNAKTTPLALLALGVVGVVSDGEVTSSSGSSGFAQGTIETDRLTAMLNSKDKIVAKLVRCSALWSTLQAGKGKLRVSEGAAYAVVGATGALAHATVSARDGSTLTLAPGCTGSVVVVASESVAESHKCVFWAAAAAFVCVRLQSCVLERHAHTQRLLLDTARPPPLKMQCAHTTKNTKTGTRRCRGRRPCMRSAARCCR
jgi:hypothetical protein